MNEYDKNLLLKFITTYPDKRMDYLTMTMAINGIINLKETDEVPPAMLRVLSMAKERQVTDTVLQHREYGWSNSAQ